MRAASRAGFGTRSMLLALAASAVVLAPGTATAQPKHYPLETLAGLGLHNVAAEPATLNGKKGLRLTISEEARRRLESMTPEELAKAPFEELAWIEGLELSSGVIEVELAGTPAPGAEAGARGLRRHRVPAAEGQGGVRRVLPASHER